MSSRHRIQCITKKASLDAHDRLLFIGGINENNTHWKVSHQEAVRNTEAGTNTFYVQAAGGDVDVIVAQSMDGHKYLKTTADGEQPHTLLRLPSCP